MRGRLIFMRTTLDIDPRVLAAAKSSVHEGHHRSLGEAVSSFALVGLDSTSTPVTNSGLRFLPTTPGHVITNEMVAEALLDD